MPNRRLQTILSMAAILAGFWLIFVLSNAMEAERGKMESVGEDDDLYLSSQRIKALSGDFGGLAADWYWINSLQYIGRKIVKGHEQGYDNIKDLRPLNPRLLYPMLDRTTTLDPNYGVAYTFGAVVLPAIDEEQAIALTEKGIAAMPNEWRFYQHLAYIYWQRGDYEKAAEVYDKGSRIEGAGAFMKQMSAKVRLEGGSHIMAREIYQNIYDTAEDTRTKEMIGLRLLQLDSLEEREEIQKILKDYQEKTGRCANSWADIFGALRTVKLPDGKGLNFMRPNMPVDPTGAPYLLSNSEGKCEATLDLKTTKIPPG
jgi:tetratricopeptide (TPR) repeat protein